MSLASKIASFDKGNPINPPENDDFIADDDFQPDESSMQGKIEHPENFLQRAIKNSQPFIDKSQGFVRGFAGAETFGGTELARMGADKLVDSLPFSPQVKEQGKIKSDEMMAGDPTSTAIGAALPVAHGAQQLAKGGIEALFGKSMAKKALPKATSKLSGSIQKVIGESKSNPAQLHVPKDEVIKVLEDGLAKAKVPSGEQAALFKRWIRALKDQKQFPGNELTADVVSELETVFGKASKFGTGSNNPILQQSAKAVNRYASGRFDILAEKAGVPEFIKNSADKSKLLRAAKAKPGMIAKLINTVMQGAAFGTGGATAYRAIKGIAD